jgi:hypothetical protein
MRRRQSAKVPRALHLARREIEQWRHRQSGRKWLPKEFWAKAVALAQEHGVHPTARTLGLKYSSLKQHLEATAGDTSKAPPSRCEFVELLGGPSPAASIRCTIEWEEAGGRMVRMHITGAQVSDLASFAERLRNRRP